MTAVRGEMRRLGADPTVVDGSGLSRGNRTSSADVTSLLASMHESAVAEAFEGSLAIAGRSGTLRRRMRGTPAAGACRAKTGTLNGVSTLAGLCDTRAGHTIAFAFLMNDVSLWRAHSSQDRALRAIVSYGS